MTRCRTPVAQPRQRLGVDDRVVEPHLVMAGVRRREPRNRQPELEVIGPSGQDERAAGMRRAARAGPPSGSSAAGSRSATGWSAWSEAPAPRPAGTVWVRARRWRSGGAWGTPPVDDQHHRRATTHRREQQGQPGPRRPPGARRFGLGAGVGGFAGGSGLVGGRPALGLDGLAICGGASGRRGSALSLRRRGSRRRSRRPAAGRGRGGSVGVCASAGRPLSDAAGAGAGAASGSRPSEAAMRPERVGDVLRRQAELVAQPRRRSGRGARRWRPAPSRSSGRPPRRRGRG